ncbi:hypothetical protein GJ744_006391 [Endocarpon pusillum]|uniref:Uncharacterized protein n=1 Tax=Endocarpon pusillum TaxID=364733 RepID=A0A8H7ASW2_9EURO|nr:hypothetical protein GJ744_006391 [Endocarpon pusillum]
MKFMQRAAASDLGRTPSTSSPLPASPRDFDGHSTKRQKISPSVPAFPNPNTSTPRSFYQSNDPSTPVSQEGNQSYMPQNYGGNAAETPWVLNVSQRTDEGHAPSSPLEYTSSPDTAIGRRRFGDFKMKSSEKKAKTRDGEPDGFLGSADSDENYEQYSERMSAAAQQNSAKPTGKRRQDQDDNKMHKTNLKKPRRGGISASSGMRQPRFDGRKYKKDKRKG